MTTAIELIAEERQRQINGEGWTAEHDDTHVNGELIKAAESYCLAGCFIVENGNAPAPHSRWNAPSFWPWDEEWKPSLDPIRNLVKAGALIVAEIERLQRQSLNAKGK